MIHFFRNFYCKSGASIFFHTIMVPYLHHPSVCPSVDTQYIYAPHSIRYVYTGTDTHNAHKMRQFNWKCQWKLNNNNTINIKKASLPFLLHSISILYTIIVKYHHLMVQSHLFDPWIGCVRCSLFMLLVFFFSIPPYLYKYTYIYIQNWNDWNTKTPEQRTDGRM